jgi:hypothetical protein
VVCRTVAGIRVPVHCQFAAGGPSEQRRIRPAHVVLSNQSRSTDSRGFP